ncbi:MAG: phosphatidylinositol transfer protein [Polyangiaceae bacterium]|nr:phosphatidylinositol transfer protein [Polyangiaceae bacterium]
MSNIVKAGFVLSLLVVGCAAAEDGASEDDVVTKPACPSTKPATVAALKAVAAQAEACGASAPATPNRQRAWTHATSSALIASARPNHRGRDNFYAEGAPQWILGKFSYGLADKDLKGEQVDIYVQRGCSGAWEELRLSSPAITTQEGEHPTVEGVEDTGGRIYVQIPEAQKLGIGHHRVRMVVAGDQSFAEQTIEVLPKGTPLFVSDVDGTLTERKPDDPQLVCDEESDFPALWRSLWESGAQPNVHEGAAAVLQKLAEAGYRPLYLTARPEWLVPHTHAFLRGESRRDGRGNLPQGVVQTTLGLTGAFNGAAEAFKKEAVKSVIAKGFKPVFGFGNRPSDVATYGDSGVPFAFYFENLDTHARSCSKVTDLTLLSPGSTLSRGNWRIRSYDDVMPRVAGLSPVCR